MAYRHGSANQLSSDGTVLTDIAGGRLLKLNPVGARIWTMLGSGSSETQIVDSMVRQYHVDRERATSDLREFVRQIGNLGIDASPTPG